MRVMGNSGLRWTWIKNIKSKKKQLTWGRRRKRAKAIHRASDAERGSGYDSTHGLMGHAIRWVKQ